MSGQLVLVLAAVGLVYFGILKKPLPTVSVPGQADSELNVQGLAAQTINTYFDGRGLDWLMLVRIAWIESGFNPTAVRLEPTQLDASIGLMQTLWGTAHWLYTIGYDAFGDPSPTDLFDPATSMYFGAAYIDWLQNVNPSTAGQGEETIVRAYNGGPGNAHSSSTEPYWQKYQQARSQFSF